MNEDLRSLAASHYENFPVGSRFIPKEYREAIHLVYAFARVADDIADEGTKRPEERIANLEEWQSLLHAAILGKADDQFFTSLAEVIQQYQLSLQLFDDLIVAFRRDANNPIYASYDDVLNYCTFSANPIGRLVLQVFRCSNDETNEYSDHICTALQLTNFWQDISVDTRRNRFYIPQIDLKNFGLQLENLHSQTNTESFRSLMKLKIDGTRKLFHQGKPLLKIARKDLRFELSLIWHGGMRILEKIELMNNDTRVHRPVLNTFDKALIFARASVERLNK